MTSHPVHLHVVRVRFMVKPTVPEKLECVFDTEQAFNAFHQIASRHCGGQSYRVVMCLYLLNVY